MERENSCQSEQDFVAASRVGFGLSQARVSEILESTAKLEAVVMRLAPRLPFEAEPWGFGDGLMRLAASE